MSKPRALLDACVLVPMPLADTLLRLAGAGMYQAFWGHQVLDEVSRTLLRRGYSEQQVARRIRVMAEHFPEALVSDEIEPNLRLPDPGDNHVLAGAITAQADSIVTLNLRHFPPAIWNSYGINVVHPDEFLMQFVDLKPLVVMSIVARQSRMTRSPEISIHAILDMLGRTVPESAQRIRTFFT